MTTRLAPRYWWALLAAGILATLIFAQVRAEEVGGCDPDSPGFETCMVYMPSDICRYLEPYTYWWGFFQCEGKMQLAAEGVTVERETISVQPFSEGWTVLTIERRYSNGTVQRFERLLLRDLRAKGR